MKAPQLTPDQGIEIFGQKESKLSCPICNSTDLKYLGSSVIFVNRTIYKCVKCCFGGYNTIFEE